MKMVKLNFFSALFIALSLLLTFTSCKKNTPTYSCDPALNIWATNNLRTLENNTRADLASYLSIDSEFAAYAAMTPAAKCQAWKEKLTIVKNEYGLTEAENAHIQKAIDYMEPSMFINGDKRLEAWGKNWEHEAQQQFGWNTAKTVLIAETWLTGDEIDSIKTAQRAMAGGGYSQTGTTSLKSCTCYYSVYCSLRGNGTCNDGGCTTQSGCGVFGRSDCSGTCG
jgi:hypothetical protein